MRASIRPRHNLALALGVTAVAAVAAQQSAPRPSQPVTVERVLEQASPADDAARVSTEWQLDNLSGIGGHAVTVVGTPRVVSTPVGRALEFNGVTDGVTVDANPIEGLSQFTIEILFEPAADGQAEQRFVHVQETAGDNRALIEMRMLDGGRWCLDTFLKHGAGRPHADRTRPRAPAGAWHVAALVFDGHEMSHYVDGVREAGGPVAFKPLRAGTTSIGVRMNRVSWFKGRIAKVRVTPYPLVPEEMMHGAVAGGPRLAPLRYRPGDVLDQPPHVPHVGRRRDAADGLPAFVCRALVVGRQHHDAVLHPRAARVERRQHAIDGGRRSPAGLAARPAVGVARQVLRPCLRRVELRDPLELGAQRRDVDAWPGRLPWRGRGRPVVEPVALRVEALRLVDVDRTIGAGLVVARDRLLALGRLPVDPIEPVEARSDRPQVPAVAGHQVEHLQQVGHLAALAQDVARGLVRAAPWRDACRGRTAPPIRPVPRAPAPRS